MRATRRTSSPAMTFPTPLNRDRTLPAHVFPQRRIFLGLRLSAIFPSPFGKVEQSDINRKSTTVVVHPPAPWVQVLIKTSGIVEFISAKDPQSSSPLNSPVSSDCGRKP